MHNYAEKLARLAPNISKLDRPTYKRIVMKLVSQDIEIFENLDCNSRGDPDVAMLALSWNNIEFIELNLMRDERFVAGASIYFQNTIEWADDDLRRNANFNLELIQSNPHVIRHIHPCLKNLSFYCRVFKVSKRGIFNLITTKHIIYSFIIIFIIINIIGAFVEEECVCDP